MVRIKGVDDTEAGWVTRRVYAAAKKLRGVVPDPLRLYAHSMPVMIAWENFRARFNRGFDVAAQGFSEGASCPIPEGRGRTPTHASGEGAASPEKRAT